MANDPITTADQLLDFYGTLFHAGWKGKFTAGGDGLQEIDACVLDMVKGAETVKLKLGGHPSSAYVELPAYVIPVGGDEVTPPSRYLQYTQEDYEALQASFGGGA